MLRLNPHVRRTAFAFAVVLVLLPVVLLAKDKDFVMPKPAPAKTYPAKDEHPMEKVTIAVDPYDTQDKAAIFGTKYQEHGFMPMFLVVTNDSDVPVALVDMKIQLVTRDRAKASPAEAGDVFRRMTKVKRRDQQAPMPWPIPRGGSGGVPKGTMAELDAATFKAKAVEPHATQAGFLFFDIGDLDRPLEGAHLYVSGVKDGDGKELMYFEVALDKYLTAQPATTTPTK